MQTKPDSTWLARLFTQYSGPLVRFLYSRTGDRGEAEDIAQEAWLRLQRLGSVDTLTNPRAFVFQTASNVMVDRRRRAVVEARHRAETQLSEDNGTDVEQQAVINQALRRVQAAIDTLPNNCRQAFVMHRARGLSYPEIAIILGVSVSMVEKYVIQALKHCRNHLGDA